MMIPFESAVRRSLERSRGGRVLVSATHRGRPHGPRYTTMRDSTLARDGPCVTGDDPTVASAFAALMNDLLAQPEGSWSAHPGRTLRSSGSQGVHGHGAGGVDSCQMETVRGRGVLTATTRFSRSTTTFSKPEPPRRAPRRKLLSTTPLVARRPMRGRSGVGGRRRVAQDLLGRMPGMLGRMAPKSPWQGALCSEVSALVPTLRVGTSPR